MPHHYSEIHLHAVWHVKGNQPLLDAGLEPIVHKAIRTKLNQVPGLILHAIGGIETHVHLCITIPPTALISELIGQMKGASSFAANHRPEVTHRRFEWQEGYGVVSFGTKALPWVVDYVRRQKDHHATGRTYERLERATDSATPGPEGPG